VSKKEKLIGRFLSMPYDFHYDEMVKLLGYFGYDEGSSGIPVGIVLKMDGEVVT